jgi:hypothetical protein
LTTRPSSGIRPPGRTARVAPTGTSSTGTDSMRPVRGFRTSATTGETSRSVRIALRARSTLHDSRRSASEKRKVTAAASNHCPITIAPSAATVMRRFMSGRRARAERSALGAMYHAPSTAEAIKKRSRRRPDRPSPRADRRERSLRRTSRSGTRREEPRPGQAISRRAGRVSRPDACARCVLAHGIASIPVRATASRIGASIFPGPLTETVIFLQQIEREVRVAANRWADGALQRPSLRRRPGDLESDFRIVPSVPRRAGDGLDR